jgi:hypothetical protein
MSKASHINDEDDNEDVNFSDETLPISGMRMKSEVYGI